MTKSTDNSKIITLTANNAVVSKPAVSQPKTILLVQTVNNRTGGIQSLLLPPGMRSLPTSSSSAGDTMTSIGIPRSKMQSIITISPVSSKPPSFAIPKTPDCITTSTSNLPIKVTAVSLPGPVEVQPAPVRSSTISELTFNSRTIQADGTVSTLKEYLCNFCQFKVASHSDFEQHFNTHVFSCNYCTFRAFTRFEVLSHKKEKHPTASEELAGYEGLDRLIEQQNASVLPQNASVPPVERMSMERVHTERTPIERVHTERMPVERIHLSSLAAPSGTSSTEVADVSITNVSTVKTSPIVLSSLSSSSPAMGTTASSVLSHSFSVNSISLPPRSIPTPMSSILNIVSPSWSCTTPLLSPTTGKFSQKKVAVTTSTSSGITIVSASPMKTTSTVGKSDDNYFTYKIVHDAAGKVQAYECDVCSYRSTKMNEIFAHASTHSLADLTKTNSVNVQWDCFYCTFSSSLQANVVSHVIACHPNKPIQLKRMMSNNGSNLRSNGRAVLLKASPLNTEPSMVVSTPASVKTPPVDKNQIEEATTNGNTGGKKSDETSDGCLWGCYYCSVQSVDRNEIIAHLKKEHSQQKLVITRRRITHLPATSSSSKPDEVIDADKSQDVDKSQPEAETTVSIGSDGQVGENDLTDGHQNLSKSRRKQVFPRKLPEEAAKSGVAEEETKEAVVVAEKSANEDEKEAEKVDKVIRKKRISIGPKSRRSLTKQSKEPEEQKDVFVEPEKVVVETKEVQTRRRRSSSKYDSLIKKMIGTEETNVEEENQPSEPPNKKVKVMQATPKVSEVKTGVTDDMPTLENVSKLDKLKSGKKTKKAMSLLTGKMVANTYVTPTCETTPEQEKEMPVLQPEVKSQKSDDKTETPQTTPQKDSTVDSEKSDGQSSGEKLMADIVCVTNSAENQSDLSKEFVYDKNLLRAVCNICKGKTSGINALSHMREHMMIHTREHIWGCPYCKFKCNRRSTILRHVQSKHTTEPLRLIREKPYCKQSHKKSGDVTYNLVTDSDLDNSISKESNKVIGTKGKLRGPRSRREEKFLESSRLAWQCPFCHRQSVFKGVLLVHLKVAHPDKDVTKELRRLRRDSSPDETPIACRVNVIRAEEMVNYYSLSTILLDNGVSLTHDLDIDSEPESEKGLPEYDGDHHRKYKCVYCEFKGYRAKLVKRHILESHSDEDVLILDTGTKQHRDGEHVHMCRSADCCFATRFKSALANHLEQYSKHGPPVPITITCPSPVEAESIKEDKDDPPEEMCEIESLLNETPMEKCVDDPPVNESEPVAPVKLFESTPVVPRVKRFKVIEGPIEYNDDGTLKGVELIAGLTSLQCKYCDCPKLSDPREMKKHLASLHARHEPIAIDVHEAESSVRACVYLCLISNCSYACNFGNVFAHHMSLEHPDVESSKQTKKKRAHKRSVDKAPAESSLSRSFERNGTGVKDKSVPAKMSRLPKPGSNSADEGRVVTSSCLSPPPPSAFCTPPPSNLSHIESDASSSVGHESKDGNDSICIDFKYTIEGKPLKKPRPSSYQFDYPNRYECVQCKFRIGNLDDMKPHLVACHSTSFQVYYCIDRRARELRKRQKVLFCREAHCPFCCKHPEELEDHELYDCTFSMHRRPRPKPADQPGPYMDPMLPMNAGGVNDKTKAYLRVTGDPESAVNDKMYQCSHCTFITTDLHNIRMHVIAEHAATEGGFAEIKTEFGTDGNIVMNVNDRGVNEVVRKAALNLNMACEKNSRSMYDAVDTIKVGDEEKVYTVL